MDKELGLIEEKLLAKQKHDFIDAVVKIFNIMDEKRSEAERLLGYSFWNQEDEKIVRKFFQDVLLNAAANNWRMDHKEVLELMPEQFDKMLLEKAVNQFLFKGLE